MIAFYEYAEKIVKIPNSIITTLALVIMPHISKLISENKIEEVHSKAEKANFYYIFSMWCLLRLMWNIKHFDSTLLW